MKKLSLVFAILVFVGFVFKVNSAKSADVTILKAITLHPPKVEEDKMFIKYIEAVEKRAGGKLKINYLGGPEVIPAVEQVDALRNGVVDLALSPATYHTSLLPEAGAFFLWKPKEPGEGRKTGLFDVLSKSYETINLRLLSRPAPHFGFNVFTNFMVKNPKTDFQNRKIRDLNTYSPFLKEIGAKGVRVPRTDVYTALERGVIEGQLGPPNLTIQLGQTEVTKYYVSPMLWAGSLLSLANLDTWKKLSNDTQNLFIDTAIEFEKEYWPYWTDFISNTYVKLKKAGLQEITFSPEMTKWYVDISQFSIWDDIVKRAPEKGPILKKICGY